MGKIYPDFVGAFTNSVGGTVYYVRNGQNFVRRKGVPKKAPTFLQEKQRAKFGMLVKLALLLQEAIRIGFLPGKRGWSEINFFVRKNKDICRMEEDGGFSVNYEKLVCAEGNLRVPDAEVALDRGDHGVRFECGEMEMDKDALPDDRIMGVVFDTKNGFCRCVELCERKEGGATSISLEDSWELDTLAVYVFAISGDGKRVSDSVYLPLL